MSKQKARKEFRFEVYQSFINSKSSLFTKPFHKEDYKIEYKKTQEKYPNRTINLRRV